MPRQAQPDYERVNIMLHKELKAEIRTKCIPYEGAKDLSSFLELGARKLIEEVRAKRKHPKQPK